MTEYTPSTVPNPASPRAGSSRLFLTGFMGAGKSTVGPLVADRLGYTFIDLDEAITDRAGQPIAALFETGEDAFRALEGTLLREVSQQEEVVVATGGGALASETNLSVAQRAGVVVYLRVSVDALAQRLADTATERPLLQDGAGHPLQDDALRERIRALLDQRKLRYEQAGVIVDAEQPPEAVASAIVKSLKAES
ncbi:MAG: shikimate kinase [Bacteroidetes bacterium]|nr:shikimate kinase [Bacteroidota bacterium]